MLVRSAVPSAATAACGRPRSTCCSIGKQAHRLSGARRPLILTSAVRDERYQRVLTHVSGNAARRYSMHTTGYAFDIARAYSSERQAAGFQSCSTAL